MIPFSEHDDLDGKHTTHTYLSSSKRRWLALFGILFINLNKSTIGVERHRHRIGATFDLCINGQTERSRTHLGRS